MRTKSNPNLILHLLDTLMDLIGLYEIGWLTKSNNFFKSSQNKL